MAKRLTINRFQGFSNRDEDFLMNLKPSEGGTALEGVSGLVKWKQKGDSGFTNLGLIGAWCNSNNEFLSVTNSYIYAIDENLRIWKGKSNLSVPFSDLAEVAQPDNGATKNILNKPSIIQSVHGDVLWSTGQNGNVGVIGRAWTGTQDGGTSSTVLTDSSETFDNKVKVGDSVLNISDASSGVVTAVSGSTITMSGGLSGGTRNNFINGDKYEVFASEFQALTANNTNSPTGSSMVTRSRQMVNFENSTYILNDNYLESFDSSLTYTSQFLRLHKGYIGECMAVNGNRLLIGANMAGKGKLHLWNGYGTDFPYKIDTQEEIQAITPFKRGWVVSMGTGLYFTDGFEIELMASYITKSLSNKFKTNFNNLVAVGESIFVMGGKQDGSGTANDYYRSKTGLWEYDSALGKWAFYGLTQNTGTSIQGGTIGALLFDSIQAKLCASYQVATISNPYFISTFSRERSGDALYIGNFDFNKEVNVQRVIVELEPKHTNETNNVTDLSLTIKAAFGIQDDYIWRKGSASAVSASASTIKVNDTTSSLRETTESAVLVLAGQNGGQVEFIDSIADDGSNPEVWTLTSALNGTTESGVAFNVMPIFKSESITISLSPTSKVESAIFENIPERAQYGRRFSVLLFFTSTSSFYFKIKAIHIDYEEGVR